MSNPAFNFAPFTRRAPTAARYRDVTDQDDPQLDEGEAADTAQFIMDSFDAASGREPKETDDAGRDSGSVGRKKAEAEFARLTSDDPRRVKATAQLVVAAGKEAGWL